MIPQDDVYDLFTVVLGEGEWQPFFGTADRDAIVDLCAAVPAYLDVTCGHETCPSPLCYVQRPEYTTVDGADEHGVLTPVPTFLSTLWVPTSRDVAGAARAATQARIAIPRLRLQAVVTGTPPRVTGVRAITH